MCSAPRSPHSPPAPHLLLRVAQDDPPTLDFVVAASNLRSYIFHIPPESRFSAKAIAGAIVPAIATTNAIIAGFIVLEALKVLRGAMEEVRHRSRLSPID